MATAIIRPTAHYATSGCSKVTNAYDNNNSTEATINNNSQVVFYAFDMSSIPKNIGTIKSITAVVTCNGTGSTNSKCAVVKLVHSATDAKTYTDCGDGYIRCLTYGMTSNVTRSLVFPKAAEYWNNNINSFINGGFQLNLDNDIITSTYFYLVEVYVEIEYTTSITVTVNASPAEGGTVTGGGTYESGSTVTATAIPNSGYAFSHWLVNGGDAGSSNPISGVLTSDTTVTAVFIKVETSKVYCGTQKLSVYCGTQKLSVYCGTQKLT